MTYSPSSQSLRSFETAARVLNFTRTAAESNLTQGAVSHQIRELEKIVGAPLFEQQARGLSLTDAGAEYLPFVREALERLRAGSEALSQSRRDKILTVTISLNFANKWLVPRLGDFAESHPDIDLRISAARRHVDFAVDGIDLGIRHGTGDWPHLHVTRLCPELFYPVCSPAYAAEFALDNVKALTQVRLLHDQDQARWRECLAAFEVDPTLSEQGPIFSDTSLAIDAAVAGQGVALARSALAALDLKAGRLVRPVDNAIPAPIAYWIVCPRVSADAPNIQALRHWLLAQAEADQAAALMPAI